MNSKRKHKSNKNQKKKSQPSQIQNNKQPMKEISPSNFKIPSQPFEVTIEIDSDWHIGSGAGIPGDVDRLVLRDRNGFPYIPAKTITGIWRDGCELVALGLDSGDKNGIWHSWVDYLFGEQPALPEINLTKHPRPAVVYIRAAAFSPQFKNAIETLENKQAQIIIRDAFTFIKPGIRIDPESGCAQEDNLRFAEMARIGASLKATCELDFGKATDEEQKEEQKIAYTLLLAGAKMVERIGGKRRRGSGKCRLVISENINPWLDLLEKSPPKPPEFSLRSTEATNWDDTEANKEDDWVRIKLTLFTETPVVIAARKVGNVVETLDYIPGTHLLPIISKRLGKNLRQAIAQGDLIVANATVQVNEEKGRPIPFAMFHEKVGGSWKEGKQLYNKLLKEKPENKKQDKGLRQGYIGCTKNLELLLYTSNESLVSSIETHNTVDDKYQRPDKEVGGVYSYQNIASGKTLQAELRLRKGLTDNLGKSWWKVLEGKIKIGTSKKDDYGLVSIQANRIEDSKQKPTSQNVNDRTSEVQLSVWLLSDVLLRDNRLRPTTKIEDFREALQTKLNEGLESDKKIKFAEDKVSAIARSRRTESWQSKWGLPRPSLVGLMAGTCIVFRVKEGQEYINAEKLADIEMSGIGERTAEGYGQICFNDPLLTESGLKKCKKLEKDSAYNSDKLSKRKLSEKDTDFNYARIIEKTAWQDTIHKAALFLANDKDSRYNILGIKLETEEGKQEKISKPSMSQLGSLRSILSKLKSPSDETVNSWIKNRRDKWFQENDVSRKSLNKISDLVTNCDKIWEYLNNGLEKIKHPKFSEIVITKEGESFLRNDLWVDAVKILVDACIRAHKRELEESRNKGVDKNGASDRI